MPRKKRVTLPQPSFTEYTKDDRQIVEISYWKEENGTAVRHELKFISYPSVVWNTYCEVDGKRIPERAEEYQYDDDDPAG